jgi:hypothetical protein
MQAEIELAIKRNIPIRFMFNHPLRGRSVVRDLLKCPVVDKRLHPPPMAASATNDLLG